MATFCFLTMILCCRGFFTCIYPQAPYLIADRPAFARHQHLTISLGSTYRIQASSPRRTVSRVYRLQDATYIGCNRVTPATELFNAPVEITSKTNCRSMCRPHHLPSSKPGLETKFFWTYLQLLHLHSLQVQFFHRILIVFQPILLYRENYPTFTKLLLTINIMDTSNVLINHY